MDKGPNSLTLQLPYLRVVDLHEESEAHADDTFSNAGESWLPGHAQCAAGPARQYSLHAAAGVQPQS